MKKATVLIVEDERIVAKDLQQSLISEGYHVPLVVSTGDDALQAVQQLNPDVILIDIQLKGNLDGIQTASQIHHLYDVPVIYLTAFADENTLRRAKTTEPFGYIIKPFEEREVYSTIEMALYKHLTEKKLKQHDRWLSATLKSVSDGVIATNTRGRIIFMNPAAERLTGWSQSETRDKNIDQIMQLVNSVTNKPVENPLAKAIETGEPVELPSDIYLKAKDDRGFPTSVSASPIIDDRGQLLGTVLVFKDNSKHLALEKQLREGQKMEAIGRLAGGIAHDFNNLLMVILGNIEFAKEGIQPGSGAYEDLERVEKAAGQARALIDQLLTFSRQKAYKKEVLDLNAAIKDFLQMVNRVIGEKIQIETSLQDDLASVLADPAHIHQILMNLCLNAKDAMPHGGRLTIETRNVSAAELRGEAWYAHLNGSARGVDYVKLSIADSGCGIDQKRRERIFEPFYTTKDVLHGTGLGLAVVYGIVDQHKGHIDVQSEPQNGTTITVYLPATGAQVAAPKPDSAPKAVQKNHGCILVVEDDTAVRKTTVRILKALGFDAVEATNGPEAIAKFREEPKSVAAAVIDVAMPEMTGPELYRSLTALRLNLPTVFVTGYDIHDKLGFPETHRNFTILRKPFTKDSLEAKLQEALGSGNAMEIEMDNK